MSDNADTSNEDVTLADHLGTLAADAESLSRMLHAQHDEHGDIHPEELSKAAALETSLKDVIHALTHHEHLAMSADDVWKTLNVEHKHREISPD